MTAEFIPRQERGPLVVSGAANSNTISDDYMNSLLISYDFIGDVKPDTSVSLFGRTFSAPIFAGPIGGAKEELGGPLAYGRAVSDAGSLYFIDYHSRDAWVQILNEGLPGVRVIKPLSDLKLAEDEIKFDEDHGALGYAMDISHGKNIYGKDDRDGTFSSKTKEDLIRLNEASPLPFILKDVQSVRDAVLAKEAGIAGLWLSGHNNRFPCAVPALYVLPKIRDAVGPDMMIFVDGGFKTGYDVFKALALGADGVMCARQFMASFVKEGPEGLTQKILEMAAQLKGAMAATGSADIAHISSESLMRI